MSHRYIQYSRRSSKENTNKQVPSIQGQREATAQIAATSNLDVIDRLEESQTAKEPGRPVFNAMLSRIQKGEADAILCWHLDRLTRNEIDSGQLRWLLRKGVIKEIRTPHRIYLPEDSVLITAVESAMGEQFIVDLVQKVNRGMHLKCKNGGIPFMVPEGYLNDRLNKKAMVDPERFPLIQRAFHLVLSETHSVRDVHRIMHRDWGYCKKPKLNSRSSELGLSSLYNLLSNTFYAGYFTWQGEVYVHDLPRAVLKEEFDRVQRILKKRAPKVLERRVFPYTGLMTCITCGHKATAEVSKGHTYYHCCNKYGTCTKRGIREEVIDEQIDALLESITLDPEFEAIALSVLDHFRQSEVTAQQSIFETQQKARADVKRQKEALLSLYLQGHLEADEYAAKKTELAERDVSLKLNEEQSDDAVEKSHETIENVVRFATQARSLFQTDTKEHKRFVATHLGARYLFNNGSLEIELNPLFVPVRSEFKVALSKNSLDRTTKKPLPKLVAASSKPEIAVWLPTLEKYRTYVREQQLMLPPLPELYQIF